VYFFLAGLECDEFIFYSRIATILLTLFLTHGVVALISVVFPTIYVANDFLYTTISDFYSMEMFAASALLCFVLPMVFIISDDVQEVVPDNTNAGEPKESSTKGYYGLLPLLKAMRFIGRFFFQLKKAVGHFMWLYADNIFLVFQRYETIDSLQSRSCWSVCYTGVLISVCPAGSFSYVFLRKIGSVVAYMLFQLQLLALLPVRRWLYGIKGESTELKSTMSVVNVATLHHMRVFLILTETTPQLFVQTNDFVRLDRGLSTARYAAGGHQHNRQGPALSGGFL
jgi:hypothetical protein